MKLTKKQMKKVVNLFYEGLSEEVCVAAIIQLMPPSSTALEMGQSIHSFYKEIFHIEVKQVENK